MKRLWWTGRGGVEALTDEQALDRLLRGIKITPLMGEEALKARLKEEASA